jgi:hypothetical protein
MVIHSEELQHPTQASTVRLNVYELDAPSAPVFGMDALMRAGRYLVTEDRIGTAKVVATLGSYATRDEAVARARQRAAELEGQHYRRFAPTA